MRRATKDATSTYPFERDLPELLHHRQRPSVSIYFPLQRRPDRRHENAIRWKNAARRASMALQSSGADAASLLDGLEQPVRDALTQSPRHPGGAAMAALIAPGRAHVYQLPTETRELVVVADRFHLKPLLAASDAAPALLVVGLSAGGVHLFEGDLDSLTEVQPPADMPRGMDDVTPEPARERRLQAHSSSARGRAPIVHGQGLGEHRRGEDCKRFLRAVRDALRATVEASDATIVLTGEPRLVNTFQDLSGHDERFRLAIPGGFDPRRPDELRERLLPRLLEHRRETRKAAVSNAAAMARAGKLTAALERLVPAADEGRIETLFVERGARCWGRYEGALGTVRRAPRPGAANEDLLDLAAVRTIEHGGRVIMVDPGSLPGTVRAAALLRY